MKLFLERLISNDDETIGMLAVDGNHYCFTLEDEYRDEKVMHETRIPEGTYDIIIRNSGGMNERYKKRFGSNHKGMIWLQNVENFEWIYIHVGNDDDATSGCILVGTGAKTPIGARWTITNSVDAYVPLAQLIYHAIDNGERVQIEIVDGDR
jgi:hypothetical protein